MRLPVSLRARLTLFTLILFVLGIWSMAIFAGRVLRDDVQAMVRAQQFSTVSMVATNINQNLDDRFKALEVVAAGVTPKMLADPSALQDLLAQRPVLVGLFNAGIVVYRSDGMAIAEVPQSSARVGLNYMDIDTVAMALRQGKSNVGRPIIGKRLGVPVFGMTVPIRDSRGAVIGALAGVINLGKPSFLDQIEDGRFGSTGGYLLVSPQHRLIVTGTDRKRSMEVLPAPGVSLVVDRFIQGYEGTEVFVNPVGVDVMASAKSIPVAGWYLAATMPTEELFAPIRHMQWDILLAASVLTLLAGLVSWWMLRRELSPLQQAAQTLGNLTDSDQPHAPLVVARQDEIGTLLTAFNRLLDSLAVRQAALSRSNAMLAETEHIGGLGSYVFDIATGSWSSSKVADQVFGIDPTYPHTSQGWGGLLHPEDSASMQAYFAAALQGTQGDFDRVYRIVRPSDQTVRWIHGRGKLDLDPQGRPTTMRGTLQDITERKQFELALQTSLKDKVALLNEVHHRVKNNLQVIASLLRLEAGRSSQEETRVVVGEMQGRIHAMALLHESLYRSGIFASVDLGSYLRQLASQAFRAHNNNQGSVRLELELASVQVSMDMATPCGLLVNELISNGLKHGFPDGRSGVVHLQLQRFEGDGKASLCVRDNGVGLGPDFELKCQKSLGLQLVSDLVRQIRGQMQIGPGPGASFTVHFTPDLATHAPEPA